MTKLHYSPNLGRLSRCTSDACPFEHFDSESMKPMAPVTLIGKPKTLKNSYQGIELKPFELAPALNQLSSAMSPKLFELIVNKKAERDGADKYHITTIRPQEYRRLKADGKLSEVERPFHYELVGVGTASNAKSQAWFVVARSVALDHYRYGMGLPKQDFHVTLGFTVSDVHELPKDESTLIK